MNFDMNTMPIACDMNVFTPDERERHIQNTQSLFRSVLETRDAENGFEFTFPLESGTVLKLADFIANERLCCPFLEFALSVTPNPEPIRLSLTGPEGTREFLREELGELFK